VKFKLIGFMLLLALSALPVYAQESTINSVTFNGISFSFDSALATNVNIAQNPGDPVEYEAPGGPQVKHTEFVLYSEFPPANSFEAPASIRIYKTADFAGYTFFEERLQQLQTLLSERPDLTPYMTVAENLSENALPFLPVFPAAQVIRARAQYVETAAVTGMSYVTVYRQDASPFMGNEFMYTFQGISADGQYYVSAIFRLSTDLFPTEIGPDFDMEAFIEQISAYFTESITQLNEATPESFTPSLTVLDAVIQSFSFGSAGS
jgi:hypothetical protein